MARACLGCGGQAQDGLRGTWPSRQRQTPPPRQVPHNINFREKKPKPSKKKTEGGGSEEGVGARGRVARFRYFEDIYGYSGVGCGSRGACRHFWLLRGGLWLYRGLKTHGCFGGGLWLCGNPGTLMAVALWWGPGRDRWGLARWGPHGACPQVFICGPSPHWLLVTGRGALRLHPMGIDGPIDSFAPFHNVNCPRGFLYFNRQVGRPQAAQPGSPWH